MPGVVSDEAIATYLATPPPPVPQFKGAPSAQLHAAIQHATGAWFRPKRLPRGKHQLEGVAFALWMRQSLLFYATRLGKTFIALTWAEHLRKSGLWRGMGLVIVHAPIALDVWESEAARHCNLKVAIVRNQPGEFTAAMESGCDLLIIPWFGLQNIFTVPQTVKRMKDKRNIHKGWKSERRRVLDETALNTLRGFFTLGIIDEIHMGKTNNTLRFKLAADLLHRAKFRLGLTGTPFGRDPFNLWGETFLIDNGRTFGKSFNMFRHAFGTLKKGYGGKQLVFDKKKDQALSSRISTVSLSYQREEVHDVNIMTGEVRVHMYGDQRAAYEDALDKIIRVSKGESQEITNTFIRMRQISSGYLPFVDNEGIERIITFAQNPKLDWIQSEIIDQGLTTQTIIFYQFTKSGEIICNALKEKQLTYGWLYGGTPDTKKVVDDFNKGHTQFLVANADKGGMSIDLPAADYILFYESPTSPIVRQQAEARPMSRGSKLLLIDDMVCSGVENRILQFIKEGRNLMADIVHNKHLLD